MMKYCLFLAILSLSLPVRADNLTFLDILEGLHETRYDRFSGYDGFDWMVRSYPEEKLVVIYFDSTTEYLDFRADFGAIVSKLFQRSAKKEHRQASRQQQIVEINNIKDPIKQYLAMQDYKEALISEFLSDTYFSLNPQNYVLNSQLHQAWRLLLDVLATESYQEYRILMVGHSFGAFLAQATASRGLMLNLVGNLNREIYALTFGSIGADGAVRNYLPTSYLERYIYTFNRTQDFMVRFSMSGSLGREFDWPENMHEPSQDNGYAFLVERLLGNHHLAPLIFDLEKGALPYANLFPWMELPEELRR
jgi:hypothetical protein